MSTLGSLFGGSSSGTDNSDALRYSAPKEPKKVSSAPATVLAPASAPAAAPAPAAATSRILASATVRLYKVNSSTGGYETVEGGAILGCVLVGLGTQFQLLVYNAQKVPLATVAVGATFSFNAKDLYMSFSDPHSGSWSILFDGADAMSAFLRLVVAASAHTLSHSVAAAPHFVRGVCPGVAGVTADADSAHALTAGMSAGVYCSVWELSETSSDLPSDFVGDMGKCLRRVATPGEVAKIKIGSGEDFIGGLSEGLSGCRKGDRVWIAISPKLAYGGSDTDLGSRRARPSAWLFAEVDIIKVKSKEEKKREKKSRDKDKESSSSRDKETPLPASMDIDEGDAPNAELVARMAKLSQQGGLGMLASAAAGSRISRSRNGSEADHSAQTANYSQQQPMQQQPMQQQPMQQQPMQQQPMQQQPMQQQQAIYQQQSNYQLQPQQQLNNYHQQQQQQQQQPMYNNYQQQPAYGNEYALALVDGQESRSFYQQQQSLKPGFQQQQQQQPQGAQHGPASLASIQASLQQLHVKLDQATSLGVPLGGLLQQQQLQQLLSGSSTRSSILASNAFLSVSSNKVRLKAEELSEAVRLIASEYEAAVAEREGSGNREERARLEEKIETLQNKNERLMNEKQALLEKQADMLQLGASSSSQSFQLQTELAQAKAESSMLYGKVTELNNKVAELSASLSSSSGAASKVQYLESEIRGLEASSSSAAAAFRAELDAARAHGEATRSELEAALDALTEEHRALREKEEEEKPGAQEFTEVAMDESATVQAYVASRVTAATEGLREELRTALAAGERAAEDLQRARNEAEMIRGMQKNISAAAATPAAAPAGVSADALKEVMQAVYAKACESFGTDQQFSSAEVVKKLRAVLKAVTSEINR